MLKFLDSFLKSRSSRPSTSNNASFKQDADVDRSAQEAEIDRSAQEAEIARGGGERQASPDILKVRADHRKRYEFAAKYISPNDHVLDLACGVGYGSYILARQTECKSIVAIDLSQDAINYANKYYSTPKIQYIQGDCLSVHIPSHHFNVCVSFETVEHISEDLKLLTRFHQSLKRNGKLLLSTPNQEEMPFDQDKFPFHCKHYLPTELTSLVNEAGFSIEEVASQKNKKTGEITSGWDGKFNLLVCRKKN